MQAATGSSPIKLVPEQAPLVAHPASRIGLGASVAATALCKAGVFVEVPRMSARAHPAQASEKASGGRPCRWMRSCSRWAGWSSLTRDADTGVRCPICIGLCSGRLWTKVAVAKPASGYASSTMLLHREGVSGQPTSLLAARRANGTATSVSRDAAGNVQRKPPSMHACTGALLA